nr:hypothetical protein [Achromobacter ruhlandii]
MTQQDDITQRVLTAEHHLNELMRLTQPWPNATIPCATVRSHVEQALSKLRAPVADERDRNATISKVVGMCNRIPGATTWNAAEFMYDEMHRRAALAVAGERSAVAYLDLGAGGYMDVGTDLTDEQLAALPKGRHMLAIIGTHGVNGYAPASAPVADERAAFEAWATAIAEKYDVTRNGDHYMEPYTEWVWEAWQERARRAALASAPVADDAKGQIEYLDMDNHRLRRALQKLMARLTDLLDEDQFANCESIVTEAGVEPPASAPVAGEAQPVAYLTRDEEGSPCMLFFDVVEARSYCALGEEPEPLFRHAAPQGDSEPVGWFDTSMSSGTVRWRQGLTSSSFPEGHPFYAAPQASAENDWKAAIRKFMDTAIPALAAIANVHTPDEIDALEAMPREPVIDQVRRLSQACEELSRQVRPERPKADKDAARCTCPSGDGSLRHPCPMHPGADKGGGSHG